MRILGPERLGGQGLDPEQEEAGNRAILALLRDPEVAEQMDLVLTWRAGEGDAPGAYEIWSARGLVRFQRVLRADGSVGFEVLEVIGENPVANQDPHALRTLAEEQAAAAASGFSADDAARRFVAPRPSDKSPVEQILGTFDSLERRFSAKDFRGCPFVNAVAELGEDRSVRKVAIAFKESRRLWFRNLLVQLGVTDAEALATQLALLVDGSIAQDLVRDDPAMARAARREKSRVTIIGNPPLRVRTAIIFVGAIEPGGTRSFNGTDSRGPRQIAAIRQPGGRVRRRRDDIQPKRSTERTCRRSLPTRPPPSRLDPRRGRRTAR
jgi:hypothetical protein